MIVWDGKNFEQGSGNGDSLGPWKGNYITETMEGRCTHLIIVSC